MPLGRSLPYRRHHTSYRTADRQDRTNGSHVEGDDGTVCLGNGDGTLYVQCSVLEGLFALEDAIGFHACLLEALVACV
jgi:hypothetical protein